MKIATKPSKGFVCKECYQRAIKTLINTNNTDTNRILNTLSKYIKYTIKIYTYGINIVIGEK